jgi:hypothetical protein
MKIKEVSISELWERPLVSEKEAARMLGLPLSTWQLLKRRSAPPVIFLGKHNRILTADLHTWLEGLRGVEPRTTKRRLSHGDNGDHGTG